MESGNGSPLSHSYIYSIVEYNGVTIFFVSSLACGYSEETFFVGLLLRARTGDSLSVSRVCLLSYQEEDSGSPLLSTDTLSEGVFAYSVQRDCRSPTV